MADTPSVYVVEDNHSSQQHDSPTKVHKADIQRLLWQTAPSLRPDTAQLAEADLAGDAEAIAVLEAWRFQPNRATRFVTLHNLDGTPATREDFARHNVSTDYEYDEKEQPSGRRVSDLSVDGLHEAVLRKMRKENAKASGQCAAFEEDEQETLTELQDEIAAIPSNASKMRADSVNNEEVMAILLNESIAGFNAGAARCGKDLWMNIKMFAQYRCEVSYKQQSFRIAGTEYDIVHSFATHAVKQVEAGKYTGKGPFSNWLNVVFRRFADTELNKLTREKKTFSSLEETMNNDASDEEQRAVSASDKYAHKLWRADDKVRSEVNAVLSQMSEADQAYAELLKLGHKKGAASKLMGESAPTSRKRKNRLKKELLNAGLVTLEACSGDAEPIPCPAESACTPLLATVPVFGEDGSGVVLTLHATASNEFSEYMTADEVANLLRVSRDTIIRRFEHEPGVLDLGSPENNRKRRYRVLRIPRTAVQHFIVEHRTT